MAQQIRHAPATAAEVQSIVANAAAERRGLEVCGGGSKRLLRSPVAADALLDMSALGGITDYDPDELVVTARSGTPLAEIEAALAERRQMLAFEPFDHGPMFGAEAGRATLGGIVAANVSGSRRVSMGAARDHILGFTAVSGRAETLKGGGAVVKNVTGFDLAQADGGLLGNPGGAALHHHARAAAPADRDDDTVQGLAGRGSQSSDECGAWLCRRPSPRRPTYPCRAR